MKVLPLYFIRKTIGQTSDHLFHKFKYFITYINLLLIYYCNVKYVPKLYKKILNVSFLSQIDHPISFVNKFGHQIHILFIDFF
jgi:hypothetical protein